MLTRERIKILNQLSKTINKEYGYKQYKEKDICFPRINLGPCGAFAKIFFDVWNELFEYKVNICFLFTKNREICCHCFIKLPNDNFFDGGRGVFTSDKFIKEGSTDIFIEEMKIYDEAELEKNAYGLNRRYEDCPNYNNEKVKSIVLSYLTRL